jgi:hypothetical protein
MHIFWIAGLLLAMVDLPDFGTPLNRIAGSAEKLAGLKPGEGAADAQAAGVAPAEPPIDPPGATHAGDAVVALPPKPDIALAKPKERIHA